MSIITKGEAILVVIDQEGSIQELEQCILWRLLFETRDNILMEFTEDWEVEKSYIKPDKLQEVMDSLKVQLQKAA